MLLQAPPPPAWADAEPRGREAIAFIDRAPGTTLFKAVLDVNRPTTHVLSAVAAHEREVISQRTRAAFAVAKARGTRLGIPRLPPAGTLAAVPEPSTPGSAARARAARAIAACGTVIEAARAVGARSLGDYAQALQAVRLPAPNGEAR